MILPTPLQALPPPTHNFTFVVDEFAPICGHEARSLLRNPTCGRPSQDFIGGQSLEDLEKHVQLNSARLTSCVVLRYNEEYTVGMSRSGGDGPLDTVAIGKVKGKGNTRSTEKNKDKNKDPKERKKTRPHSTDYCCHQTTKGGSRGDGKNKNTTGAHDLESPNPSKQ